MLMYVSDEQLWCFGPLVVVGWKTRTFWWTNWFQKLCILCFFINIKKLCCYEGQGKSGINSMIIYFIYKICWLFRFVLVFFFFKDIVFTIFTIHQKLSNTMYCGNCAILVFLKVYFNLIFQIIYEEIIIISDTFTLHIFFASDLPGLIVDYLPW